MEGNDLAKTVPGMSVSQALVHPTVSKALQAYCMTNSLHEIFDFAKTVEAFKQVPEGPARTGFADLICREYFTVDGEKALPARWHADTLEAAKSGRNDCFDIVLKECNKFLLMSWPMFLKSPEYYQLIASESKDGTGRPLPSPQEASHRRSGARPKPPSSPKPPPSPTRDQERKRSHEDLSCSTPILGSPAAAMPRSRPARPSPRASPVIAPPAPHSPSQRPARPAAPASLSRPPSLSRDESSPSLAPSLARDESMMSLAKDDCTVASAGSSTTALQRDDSSIRDVAAGDSPLRVPPSPSGSAYESVGELSPSVRSGGRRRPSESSSASGNSSWRRSAGSTSLANSAEKVKGSVMGILNSAVKKREEMKAMHEAKERARIRQWEKAQGKHYSEVERNIKNNLKDVQQASPSPVKKKNKPSTDSGTTVGVSPRAGDGGELLSLNSQCTVVLNPMNAA